jgi:chromosome segregation ATPase
MPRQRRRQNENRRDGEISETEENYLDVSNNSSSNGVGAGEVGERGDGNGNDRASNKINGGRSRQSRDTSQREYQLDLGPWTQAVHETVQSMGAAHQAIKDLQDKFKFHIDDLHMVAETSKRLNQLEDECREKDDELTRQENTITTLTRFDQRTKDDLERKRVKIEEEKNELDQEKGKLEKRVSMATAEERHKLTREVETLRAQQTEKYEQRVKELEAEFARKKDENDRRVTALEAEKGQLSTTVEKQKRTVETQGKKLKKITEQCDVLERAKDSVKRDKQALEEELEMMKKEFALTPKSKDYLYVF